MNTEQITIRPARPDDAALIAQCVLMGLGNDLDNLSPERQRDLVEIRALALSDDTLYSYRNTLVAELGGTAVGAMVAYDGSRYRELRARSFTRLSYFSGMDIDTLPVETGWGEFYFDTLAVLPRFRGRGVARLLFNEMIAFMRRYHPTLMGALLVNPRNPAARSLYSSLGFFDSGQVFAFDTLYDRMILR